MAGGARLTEAAMAAVQSPRRVEVLLLLETGAWTTSELAAELGVHRATAVHHVRALVAAGLVREASREAIAGGPLRSYATVSKGWAQAIASLNEVASGST